MVSEVERPTVTPDAVRELAGVAELPLGEERQAVVAADLNGLLRDANLVNAFMAGRRDVGPGVRYLHEELRSQEA